MCVGAALGLPTVAGSGLFGLSAASAFNIGLGLTAANAFAGRAAAQDRASQTYNQALLANQSAERDKRQQQLALSECKDNIYLMFRLQNHSLKVEEISYKVILMKLIMLYQV